VVLAPEAGFTADVTVGAPPLYVYFTDQSTGQINQWAWDFDNDGTVDSTEQNPSHTYSTAGAYTVSLTVTGHGGSDMETKADYVYVTTEEVIITVGLLTDLTGPASPALMPVYYALQDLMKYINEEQPISGVKLRLFAWDTRYDASRFIPGYDWCRGKGASVILTAIPEAGEILKPFAAADEITMLNVSATTISQIDPPGWVFCSNSPARYQVETLLKWIAESSWDYGQGIPKIGFVGWQGSSDEEVCNAMGEYCQYYPGQVEWVGGYLAPVGTMTWAVEREALKDCDYVCLSSVGMPAATFAKQFREHGYEATFIGMDALAANLGYIVDYCGWSPLDGTLTAHSTRWWNDQTTIVNLAKQLLNSYRPSQEEDIIDSGLTYIDAFQKEYLFFDILREAIEEVGAHNFDCQALYDAAIGFEATYQGLPAWGFTDTIRYASKHIAIYRWSAVQQDPVRVTGWLPVITG
jgi:PKD repeat protein